MTQIESARAGEVTAEMESVAKSELTDPGSIRRGVADGVIVIPKNRLRRIARPCGIGEGLRTKINTNVGTSKDSPDITREVEKVRAAVALGSDAVMDLSTGSDTARARGEILAGSEVPVGTVPIYEMVIRALAKYGSVGKLTAGDIFSVLEAQAKDGVDFFTIHAGVTRRAVELLRDNPRVLDIVSRGGAFLAEWILENNAENPLYEHFDEIIALAKEYDITLSLGDGMRPGSVYDATDSPQIEELRTLGELQKRAHKKGVQVIIEGPGHVPINQIEANVMLEKSLCAGAPFYVLGPLVTDVAPGYDHITAAIGGAVAGAAGADFLCYVTPSEHLRLPTLDDVREGVVATKIAAHAADIAKGVRGAIDWDVELSKARRARDWKRQFELAIDKEKPAAYRRTTKPTSDDVCTMCSDYCSIKISEECFKKAR